MTSFANVLAKFKPLIVQPTSRHTATVIFLHGSGGNGADVNSSIKMCFRGQEWVEPHIKLIYPTAPPRPYTAAGGMMENVWFDRKDVTPHVPEESNSMDEMCENLDKVINEEVQSGTPKNRITLGGFSMGGAMSLYYGLQHGKGLAGIFCLSSFMYSDSKLYEVLKSTDTTELPPVFQAHGHRDDIVYYQWGKETQEKLSALGINISFQDYPSLYHQISTKEMKDLKEWIHGRLPP